MNRRKPKYKYVYRYPVSPIEVDQFNTQTLEALHTKLSRDYLGLFRSLQKLYQKGKQRKALDSTVKELNQTVALLNNILRKGSISKEDAETLTTGINKINEDKDYFLQQAQGVQAFRERLDQVSEATGVSLEDLNITEEIVRRGVRQARKKPLRKAVSALRGAMPETRGVIGGLARGAGVAALGPFAPLAGMGIGALRDVLGLGRRVGGLAVGAVRERRQARLGRMLRPAAYRAAPEELEYMAARRGVAPGLSAFRGLGRQPVSRRRSREEAVAPLTYFFNKKAYRAKWTRDVLKWIKESGKGKGKFRTMLTGLFTSLGAAIGPLLGAAGFAALAVGVGHSIYQFNKLRNVWKDYTKAKELERKAHERQMKAWDMQLDHLEKRIKETKPEWEEVRKTTKFLTEQREIREHIGEYQVPAVAVIDPFYRAPLATPPGPGIERMVPGPGVAPLGTAPRAPEISSEMFQKLMESINNLSEQVKRDREAGSIKEVGLGNLFDSGDVLVNIHASGELTGGGD